MRPDKYAQLDHSRNAGNAAAPGLESPCGRFAPDFGRIRGGGAVAPAPGVPSWLFVDSGRGQVHAQTHFFHPAGKIQGNDCGIASATPYIPPLKGEGGIGGLRPPFFVRKNADAKRRLR
jgi:hypothetical protein